MNEVRKQARPLFDEKVAPRLREMGVTDMEKEYPKSGSTWRWRQSSPKTWTNASLTISESGQSSCAIRTKSHAEFDKRQAELGDACKLDVGSQVLRVALAPVGWVAGNFEAAKNEKNIVTQAFARSPASARKRSPTRDARRRNSELRKVLEPVIGGPNGAIQKGAKDFANAVNPFKWKFN